MTFQSTRSAQTRLAPWPSRCSALSRCARCASIVEGHQLDSSPLSSKLSAKLEASISVWVLPGPRDLYGDFYALLHPQLHFPIWGRPSEHHCPLQTPCFWCWRSYSSKSQVTLVSSTTTARLLWSGMSVDKTSRWSRAQTCTSPPKPCRCHVPRQIEPERSGHLRIRFLLWGLGLSVVYLLALNSAWPTTT